MIRNLFRQMIIALGLVQIAGSSIVYADSKNEIEEALSKIAEYRIEIQEHAREFEKNPSATWRSERIRNLRVSIEHKKEDIKRNSNRAFTRTTQGKDERTCMLNIAKAALGLFGSEKESVILRWGEITLEENVYFERHTGNDFFTIYGRAEKLSPKEFKVQFRAQWNASDNELPSCSLGTTSPKPLSGYPKSNPVVVINALDTIIMTRDYEKSAEMLPISEITGISKGVEVTKLSDKFKKERIYSPVSSETTKGVGLTLPDENHMYLAGGEAALWIFANKYAKFNAIRKLRIARIAGKIFIVGEQSTHLIESYEVVSEGGKPKMIPVKDASVLERIKNTPERLYEFFDAPLKETGVLQSPTSYLDLLETSDPKTGKTDEGKMNDGKAPLTAPAPGDQKQRMKESLVK